jgi:hypothetical protein
MLLSSSPKIVLQNVISDTFSSSAQREFINWREPIFCVHSAGILTHLCDFYPVAPLPFSLVQHYPSPLPRVNR